MIDPELEAAAARLLERCRRAGLTLATAESCTGGLIAATLTAVPGSSDVVLCGFVTYSNGAKQAMLGVESAVLARAGAVSEAVATAMAANALVRSGADLVIAVTGIAGPGGGTAEKPVGLVWLAAARRDRAVRTERRVYPGNRADVRAATVQTALEMLTGCLP